MKGQEEKIKIFPMKIQDTFLLLTAEYGAKTIVKQAKLRLLHSCFSMFY